MFVLCVSFEFWLSPITHTRMHGYPPCMMIVNVFVLCVCSSFGYPPSPTQECMRIRMYDANSESIHYPCMRTDALSVHCTALMHCTLCIRCHALYEYVTHYPWVIHVSVYACVCYPHILSQKLKGSSSLCQSASPGFAYDRVCCVQHAYYRHS